MENIKVTGATSILIITFMNASRTVDVYEWGPKKSISTMTPLNERVKNKCHACTTGNVQVTGLCTNDLNTQVG